MMGAPIFLFAKSLGASSTVLGIIQAFTPLMTTLQLPAAQHIHRYGYRQFVLMGWGARTVFIFVVALIPIAPFLDAVSKMAILMVVLFIFNFLRGISSAAWMPWIATLIPEENRGRFLSIDQIFMYVGCLISLIVSATALGGDATPWQYSLVFLMSAIGGSLSLGFIKRMPDVPIGEATRKSSQPVPWREIFTYPPFFSLIVFNLIFTAVIGSLGVFTVEFLNETHFRVSEILYFSAFSFIGSLIILPVCGAIIDQTGSKPILRVSLGLFGVVIALWCLMAAHVIPRQMGIVVGLNVLSGVATAMFGLANARITMSTMPELGRTHFFALSTVITSLGLGAAPVAWGLMLDALGTFEFVTSAFHWKRHSIYFLALFVLNAVSFLYISRLHEASGAGRRVRS